MQLNQRSPTNADQLWQCMLLFHFSLFHTTQLPVPFPLTCCSWRHAAAFKCNFLLIQLKHVLRRPVTVGRVAATELQLTAAHWVGRRLSDLSLSPTRSLSLSLSPLCTLVWLVTNSLQTLLSLEIRIMVVHLRRRRENCKKIFFTFHIDSGQLRTCARTKKAKEKRKRTTTKK